MLASMDSYVTLHKVILTYHLQPVLYSLSQELLPFPLANFPLKKKKNKKLIGIK